jgi:hypothetical protein
MVPHPAFPRAPLGKADHVFCQDCFKQFILNPLSEEYRRCNPEEEFDLGPFGPKDELSKENA